MLLRLKTFRTTTGQLTCIAGDSVIHVPHSLARLQSVYRYANATALLVVARVVPAASLDLGPTPCASVEILRLKDGAVRSDQVAGAPLVVLRSATVPVPCRSSSDSPSPTLSRVPSDGPQPSRARRSPRSLSHQVTVL
jgi:hypothetical protein